ncbi:MAG: tetratricopeptide repeat protein [Microcoleaceae cyanobacterium]
MSIGLCMIVKNEESNLLQCLESVKPLVDEIVVLDTGSTDRTIQIARELGSNVYEFTWCHDFAVARNVALSYATQDWVLVLDADERLAPEIIPTVNQLTALENCLVVNLVRQEIGATQSPYSLVSRLFRRHPNLQFSRPYHALIDDSVIQLLAEEPGWKVTALPEVAIFHYGYQTQAIAQRNKLQTAKQAMEAYYRQYPHDPYVASKLGALYVEIGEIVTGIHLLERGLNQLTPNPSDKTRPQDHSILYELHYHLGIAYRKQHQVALAKTHYQAATNLDILPRLKLGAYNNLGSLYKEAGDLPEAKTLYEQMLSIDPSFAMGYYNLGMTLRAMGQYSEAIAAYETAIQLDPDYAEAYQNLGVVLLQLGQIQASLAPFQTAIALYKVRNPTAAQQLHQGLVEMGLLL